MVSILRIIIVLYFLKLSISRQSMTFDHVYSIINIKACQYFIDLKSAISTTFRRRDQHAINGQTYK